MKRFFSYLLIVISLSLMVGCNHQEEKNAIFPPVRVGSGTMYMQLERQHTVESAFEEAYAVARVKIGDWLGENTEHMVSYFKAIVMEEFKGDLPQSFTLIQDGCSTATQAGYPLFTAGNELLLFLHKASGEEEYQPAYWIVGAFTTIMDVAYDVEGNRYYTDRYDLLCKNFFDCPNYTYNSTVGEEIQIEQSVQSYLISVDPYYEIMDYEFHKIYRGADLENYLRGL